MKRAGFIGKIACLFAAAGMLGISVTTAAAAVDGPEVSWRLSTWGNPRAFTEGVEHLAKRLDEETGGKFQLKVFHGEALSKSKENLDGLKINAFEAAMFCNFYHPGKNPAFMVFALPFIPLGDFEVSAHVRHKLYEHPALKADMEQWNAMTYASTLLPQYEFLGRGEPPLKLEDWKGLRVRAGGGVGQAMEKLGATRQTVTATETYTAIQRGTMDAISLPFTYAQVAYKIHEVADWYTSNLTPGTSDCPIVLNKTAYEKLPEQYQKLLWDLRPEVTEVHINAYKAADKKNFPILDENLEKIVYDEETLAKFREAAGKPVWDEWVAENKDKFDAQDILDKLFQYAEEAKKQ